MNLVDTLLTGVQTEVFGGVLAASLVAGLLVALKSLPGRILGFLQWRFTSSLMVFSEDSAFERVSEWLAEREDAKRCRRMRLSTAYDEASEEERAVVSPGLGLHLFWFKNRPVLVSRTLPDKGGIGGWKRCEDIRLETFGSPELLRELVEEIRSARRRVASKTIDVYLYRQRWRLVCRKPKRTLESVVLPSGQMSSIVRDIEEFFGARAWYSERGIPYRRGYLLEGPPGCGKSSLAMALASHFSRPIYALNLGSVANDDELIDAVCAVPEHAVLLLEDIDAAKAGASRREEPQPIPGAPTGKSEQPREVSLSGLLNVIDGVFAREGRLLIMTTNHPERVDQALLRPGRADRRELIGPLDTAEAIAMSERFFGEDKLSARRFVARLKLPIVAAELQEKLVQETRGRAA